MDRLELFDELFPEREIDSHISERWQHYSESMQRANRNRSYMMVLMDEYDFEDWCEAEWFVHQMLSEDEEEVSEWENQYGEMLPETGVRNYDHSNGNLQQEIAEVGIYSVSEGLVVEGRIPLLYDDVLE